MRWNDIIGTGIRNTFHARLRTSLTAAAIFVGAFTLTITSALGAGISEYIQTQVAAVGSSDTIFVTKANATQSSASSGPQKYNPDAVSAPGSSGGRPSFAGGGDTTEMLTTSDVTTVSKINGVTSVTPAVQLSPDYIQVGGHDKYQLTLQENVIAGHGDLASGEQLDDSASELQILLPTSYVGPLGLGSNKDAIGQAVTIAASDYLGTQSTVTAAVVGVQNATLFSSAATANNALRDALVAIQNTGKPASVVTAYSNAIVHYDTATTTSGQIKSRLSDKGYTGETIADRLGSVQTVINGIVGVLDAFAIIALLASAFGIVNTLLMSVQERTREIGLMKAMGMGSGRVFGLFSIEAIFIGFLGSAIGAGVAAAVGTFLGGRLAAGPLSALPGLRLLLFQPQSIAVIVLIVMAVAFLAGTLPARRAARLDPITALRYE